MGSQEKLKSVWKCRQPGCKARVHTNDISNVIIKMTNEHIHEVSAVVLDLRSIDPKAEIQEKDTSDNADNNDTEQKSVMIQGKMNSGPLQLGGKILWVLIKKLMKKIEKFNC